MGLAATLVVGCGDEPASDAAAPQAVALSSGPRLVTAEPVTGPSAFDVVGIADGALVFVADRARRISTLRLSSRGALVERSSPVRTTGEVTELVGAFGGGRFAAAWVEEGTATASVHTMYGSLPSLRTGEPVGHGESVRGAGRGRLALFAADDGRLRLVRRATPYDCTASEGLCARYAHTELGTNVAPRSIDWMEIEDPCEPMVAGAAASRGAWFYSVCAAAPVARAHVFSLRPDISYAAVNDGPAECTPIALLPAEGAAWSVTRCGDERVVDVVPADPVPSQRLTNVSFEIRCGDARGVLLVAAGRDERGAPAERALNLERPRSGLGAVVLSGSGEARAAWTGEALIVGRETGGSVRFERHECRHGALVDTTLEGASR